MKFNFYKPVGPSEPSRRSEDDDLAEGTRRTYELTTGIRIMRPLWLGGATFSAILGLLAPDSQGHGSAVMSPISPRFRLLPRAAPVPLPDSAQSCTSDSRVVAVAPDGTVYAALTAFTATAQSAGMANCSPSRRTASS